MKTKLFAFFMSIALIFSCFSFASCKKEEDQVIIHTIRTVGTYSGYRVDSARIEIKNFNTFDVVSPYYVDDVYISTFPTPGYGYLAYNDKNEYVHLTEAYAQGLITHDDLLAIAEAEKPYDNLRQDNDSSISEE